MENYGWALIEDDKHACSKCGHPAIPKYAGEDDEITEYLTPFCPYCGTKLFDLVVPNDEW